MLKIGRRELVGALGVTSIAAMFPSMYTFSDDSVPVGTREIDISKYDRTLLPREHGQLGRMVETLSRRYPSREHCMQMAAFFNDTKGLLVIANDPRGGTADWIIRPRKTLRIDFYETTPDVIVMDIEPTIQAAANAYRSWASQQFWIRGRSRTAPRLDFVSVASCSSAAVERQHLDDVFEVFGEAVGVWFTQWRRFPFDRKYPDYAPKEPGEFAKLLAYIHSRSGVALPYINGILWDQNLEPFKAVGEKLSVCTKQKNRVSYNDELKFLQYACPYDSRWQDEMVASRNGLKDAEGRLTRGVYLDMLGAVAPMNCWATDHGHPLGDMSAWRSGVRQLLKKIDGLVMTEGCAEVYLDLFDYPLMHLHTAKEDTVPLWRLVYGDIVQSLGWSLPKGVDSSQFKQISERCNSAGLKSMCSPWMTSEPELDLFERRIFKSVLKSAPPMPPIPNVKSMRRT